MYDHQKYTDKMSFDHQRAFEHALRKRTDTPDTSLIRTGWRWVRTAANRLRAPSTTRWTMQAHGRKPTAQRLDSTNRMM